MPGLVSLYSSAFSNSLAVSSLWRCSRLVETHMEVLRASETTKTMFFVPLNSTSKAEVRQAQEANNLLGDLTLTSELQWLQIGAGIFLAWHCQVAQVPGHSCTHSHQVLKGQELRPLWLFKGLFSFSRTISKRGSSPKSTVSIKWQNHSASDTKLTEGHKTVH